MTDRPTPAEIADWPELRNIRVELFLDNLNAYGYVIVHDDDVISREQWKADCDTLLLAAMYGNPPGGWSDPDRIAEFQADLADIERRLRETTDD